MAETEDGTMVGFVMGENYMGEYGIFQEEATLDTIMIPSGSIYSAPTNTFLPRLLTWSDAFGAGFKKCQLRRRIWVPDLN
jgi:hypothetical protein